MHTSSSCLRVAPTSDGICIHIDGRASMSESPSADAVAQRTLRGDPHATVVFDLSACEYLDSTFLGCLIHLFRDFSHEKPPRFWLASPGEKLRKILGACHLDRVLPIREEIPEIHGEWVPIPSVPVGSKDLARHIMQCHQLLAELDSPMRMAFAKIAEQLQRELASTS